MQSFFKFFPICLVLAITTFSSITAISKVTVKELTSGWTLRNQNKTIEINGIKLPSGVYSALSSRYGDILQSYNDDTLRWIAFDNWTYTAVFDVEQVDLDFSRRINLTLAGIDTVSTVRLNGKVIGKTENMFLRYSFDIKEAVKLTNILEIEITSPIWASQALAKELEVKGINYPPKCPDKNINGFCFRNMLRKMQASFGAKTNLAAMSMGIWKYVSLEFYDIAIMRDVDITVRKNNTHWLMDIRVFLSSGIRHNFYGNFTFLAPDLLDAPIAFGPRIIRYASLTVNYQVDISREDVQEWWPNGYGEQKLYPIVLMMKCFEEIGSPKFHSGWVSQKFLSFGFRTIELVEDKDYSGRTFYFKVNDRPIFIKGAIYLPSHILPEEESHLSTAGIERIKHIMQSAKNSNLNMIRIWGGGVYGSDLLYSLADDLGILVWQDMPFTTSTYPITDDFVSSVRVETAQNAKRLAYHPSLALFATNNEIELYLVKNRSDFGNDANRLEEEYTQFFMGTVKHELNIISRNEYNPRPGPLLSTPSLGYKESKKDLPADPQDINYGDIHYWPDEKLDAWDSDLYPMARFVSEYGFQSLPVHVSWNRTLAIGDTILDVMQHRQHHEKGFKPIVELINRHLPFIDWKDDVETFIYFSQVAQAMAVKTATEVFLSNRINYRTMGAIYWQLNDVWIAPTWSSIDYYGNYKLLYYWSKQFLAPITIVTIKDSANRAIKVTLLRDGDIPLKDVSKDVENIQTFNVTIHTYLWSKLYPQRSIVREEYLGNNTIKQFSLSLDNLLIGQFNENNCFIEVVLSHADTVYASNIFFPGKIKDAIGITDPGLTVEVATRAPESNTVYILSYSLAIRIKRPALFVYIEVYHPEIIKYELSQNGFLLKDPICEVHLTFEYKFKELEVPLTTDHIKVSTINQFMTRNDGGKSTASTTTTTTGTTTVD